MATAKPKTLAELRESPDIGLPEKTYELCLSGKLNVELNRIEDEITAAEEAQAIAARAGDGDSKPTARLSAKSPIMKLNAERDKLRDRMKEHSVTVRFRAKPAHEWRKWVANNPPKDKSDDPERPTLDERLGYSAGALQDSVHEWIVDVGGAPLANGDWQFMIENAAPGDLWRMAGIIRALHESGVEIPKSWTPFLKTQENVDG